MSGDLSAQAPRVLQPLGLQKHFIGSTIYVGQSFDFIGPSALVYLGLMSLPLLTLVFQ
jgi:hypothetical protein